jgi:putative CocE/NonD family hydrolase
MGDAYKLRSAFGDLLSKLSRPILTLLFSLLSISYPVIRVRAEVVSESSLSTDAYHSYGYIRMSDGVNLAYVIWLPKKTGQFPTLLTYDPYNAGGVSYKDVQPLLDGGYAVLGVNVRGTGCSEGTYSFTGPKEGPDGAVVVEWAASQPWSNGSIGMFGSSNGGMSQLAVAAQRPAHLRAITPSAIAASVYREEGATSGGMIHLGEAAEWTFDIQPMIAGWGIKNRESEGDTLCRSIRESRPKTTSFYNDVLRHPLNDEWWESRALENSAGRVSIPTLIMETWQDQYDMPDGALRIFQLIQSEHKSIILENGQHGGAWDITRWKRWLDHWVKGIDNGAEHDPAVVVLWEQGGRGASGWTTTYPTWPVPTLERDTFYLSADGTLSESHNAVPDSIGVRSYVYPMGTELVGSEDQFALAPEKLGTLNYETKKMDRDMALLGNPVLDLFFSSEQADTSFFFTLKDIDENGNVMFLQRAYLRASLREVDSARSTEDYIAHTFKRYQMLTPGKVYEAKLSLGAIGHVVRKNHRLQLSILAPNEIPSPVMGSAPVGGVSINKVYQSDRYPSTLVLPVIPGETAHAAPPVCGSLPMQPCRYSPENHQGKIAAR